MSAGFMAIRAKAVIAAILCGLITLSVHGAKAADAYTSTSVSMRAGPSTDYPRVLVLNAGVPVTVYGCLQDYSWCDTSFQDARGWVAGSYLTYPYQGNRVAIPAFGAQLGLAVLNFSLNDYWGSYYRNRPWYGRRDYWNRHARPEYIRPGFGRPPPRPRPPVTGRPPRPNPPPAVRPPRPKPPVTKPPRPNPGQGGGTRPPRPNPGQGGGKPGQGGNKPGPGNKPGSGNQGPGNKPPRPTTRPANPAQQP
jgi:uncharacterized protein YraI